MINNITKMIATAGPTKAQIAPLLVDSQQLKFKTDIFLY